MIPLLRSTPSLQGVDPAAVVDFIEALEAAPEIEPHSVMLLRHGQVVAQGWWHPYSAQRVHLLYSLSKSFTSTAVGFAVSEGLMSLDATVLSYFPELDKEITDPRSRSMLVRHVAAMASGHRDETIDRAMDIDPSDVVRGFLMIPPEEEPGSIFAYNQPCTYALAAIVQKVSGLSLTQFLRPRLLDPLGIDEVGWIRDGSGREIGFSGLHATTEAVAKLGQLYLQNGQWQGEQLLPAQWVAQATGKHIDNDANTEPDWRQGYGFQFWMARHGYRGDGAYGQFCVILPEHDVVLAITSRTSRMQSVLDLVWQHLLPGFHQGADEVSADGEDALLQRLSELTRPPVRGAQFPDGIRYQVFRSAAGNDQSTLTQVSLRLESNDKDSESTWQVGLVEGEDRIEAVIGMGEWVVSDVVAVSGAWIEAADSGRAALLIDIAFIETPHTLHLRCEPDSGLFHSRWIDPPLHAIPLAKMRMPAYQPQEPGSPLKGPATSGVIHPA